VTVANATGAYDGNPYITVSSAPLGTGQSVSFNVHFSDPSNTAIQATPVIYSGAF